MDQRFDTVKIQGLSQAGHGPKMKDLFFLGLWHETCDQGHRHTAEMTDPFQDFFPVHERHPGIKEDEIVMMVPDLLKPLFSVQGAIDFIAFLLEGFTELLTDHFFVIDDQEFNDGLTPKR
jgi:hypothetical protein